MDEAEEVFDVVLIVSRVGESCASTRRASVLSNVSDSGAVYGVLTPAAVAPVGSDISIAYSLRSVRSSGSES